MFNLIHTIVNIFLSLVLPTRCLGCENSLLCPGYFCYKCLKNIHFIEGSACYRCGIPFDYDLGPQAECGTCHHIPPVFDQTTALVVYDASIKPLILRLKYGDATYTAPTLGAWLAHRETGIHNVDIIIPVPLSWPRLWKRQYNQAGLLASAMAAHLDSKNKKPVIHHLLKRRSPQFNQNFFQGTLGKTERYNTVRHRFYVNKKDYKKLTGKTVLLVDDVMTTGATANECAIALKKAGVRQVKVVVIARTLRT